MSEFFGFAGAKGSGKTAAAEAMHKIVGAEDSVHLEFSDSVILLANNWMSKIENVERISQVELDELKEATNEAFGLKLTDEQLKNLSVDKLDAYLYTRHNLALGELGVSIENKETHRGLLQWLGHEFATKVDENFWNDVVESTIKAKQKEEATLITIGGVRYKANSDLVRANDGRVVEVIRFDRLAITHQSEVGLSPEDIDITVSNKRTIGHLALTMVRLWEDTQQGGVKREYF